MISRICYRLGVAVYHASLRLAARLGHRKAEQWVRGRKNLFEHLARIMDEDQRPLIWMHCASLGEFEQGRPVLELLKQRHPGYFYLLTFFSPSGYEARKDEPLADGVSYLPPDNPENARKFVELTRPKLALFVKYEFWMHYLEALKEASVPHILFSAVFRPNQIFFKAYAPVFRDILRSFDLLIVQDADSETLLKKIGIEKTMTAPDTRFDRVRHIAQSAFTHKGFESLGQRRKIILAGSIWPSDLPLLRRLNTGQITLIIAPHEIDEDNIRTIAAAFDREVVRSSRWEGSWPEEAVIIMDHMGQLAGAYRYADLAIIGGGYGRGIHNILEAAVYGIPLAYGPRHQKFIEARELLQAGAALSDSPEKLARAINELLKDEKRLKEMGAISKNYVHAHLGGSEQIVKAAEGYL